MIELRTLNRLPNLVSIESVTCKLSDAGQIELLPSICCGELVVNMPDGGCIGIALKRIKLRLSMFEPEASDRNTTVNVIGITSTVRSSTSKLLTSHPELFLYEKFTETLALPDNAKMPCQFKLTLELQGSKDLYLTRAEGLWAEDVSSNKQALMKQAVLIWFASKLESHLSEVEGLL